MINVTPELVIGLWAHLEQTFGSRIIQKARAQEMTLIGQALEKMGILDSGEFIRNYSTTLGNNIYIPFSIGVPREDGHYDLAAQLRICAHEHQHVIQAQREGLVVFAAKYLADSTARAVYEAEAFRCTFEMEKLISGRIPDPYKTAAQLEAYACTPEDIAMAAKALEIARVSIQYGAITTEASRVAHVWLLKNS